MTSIAPPSQAVPVSPPASVAARRRWGVWPLGLVLLGLGAAVLTAWGVWNGSQSDYYASIALSMSKSWSNFFFGAFDPAGTVTLDKIPGSFWVPALFVRVFGFSTWAIILPNALAAVGAALITAVTAKRVAGTTAGLLAGAVVATTPILVAVSRSNQPESFFVLAIAAAAWAAVHAVQKASFGWLVAAGLFIAAAFQCYMLEAWAAWPALGIAYLCSRQPWVRKIWTLLVAGVVSAAASVAWIVIVSLVPASSRPYIGSTLHNSAWEMVFGYNGLGRFGSSTADSSAYNSFTPPFSGSAGIFRLFNTQLAGQIGWLVPVTLLALVVLWIAKVPRTITVLIGVWFLTYAAMFSVVAGMHQFYTASLAVPMALAVGLAFGAARKANIRWAQASLVGVAALTALIIGISYGGYSIVVSILQLVAAAVAIGLIYWERARTRPLRFVTALVAGVGLLLTPTVWSVVTMSHPSSINPVAGGVADMSGGMGGPGGGQGGPGGQGGFGGQTQGGSSSAQGGPGGFGSQSGSSSSQGGFGSGGPGGAGGPGGSSAQGGTGTQGGFGGSSSGSAQGGLGGQGIAGMSSSSSSDAELMTWLEQHATSSTEYLVATFGAQQAAGLIIGSDGGSVLPIGGFSGSDPVPTLAEFQALVSSGKLTYVLLSGTGGGGGGMGGSSSGTSSEIQSWVEQNCSSVSDSPSSNLYSCSASSTGS